MALAQPVRGFYDDPVENWDSETDTLGPADNREASPLPGVSRSAFDELARQILQFDRLSLCERLRAIDEDLRWADTLARMAEAAHGSRA